MTNDSSVRKKVAFSDDAWMTVSQAAKELGCAPQTVYQRALRGEIDTTRVAGRIFVARASVQRALAAQGA